MDQRLLSAMERRPNGDLEFSWKRARLNGQNILPEVRDQGNSPTCVFQAACASAEMAMMRNLANRDPPSTTDIRFNAELLAHDYEEEIGFPLDEDHGLGHTVREDTGLRLFRRIGAFATSSGWEGHQRVKINSYCSLSTSNFQRVAEYIIQGTPLLGTMPTGDDFRTMRPDDIHELRPASLVAGTLPCTHMVLFVGYGYRNRRPYLVFLNSNDKSFADEGFGRVYFDQIYQLFYTLNARAPDASVRTTHHNQDASASTSATTLQATPSSSARPGPANPDAGASTSSTTLQLSSSSTSTPPTASRRRDDQSSPPRPAQRRRL